MLIIVTDRNYYTLYISLIAPKNKVHLNLVKEEKIIICEQADNKVSVALGQVQLISEGIINCYPP